MNKEQLIELGLTEEQADKVVTGFGAMVPKARLDEKIKEAKEYKDQVAERDTQLTDLQSKAAGNESLQTEITRLQNANKDAQTKYENDLKDIKLSAAIKLALNGNVQDVDIVSNLLDKSKVELNEDGTVKDGLESQISSLKEAKPFLFVDANTEIGDSSNPGGQDKALTQEQFSKMNYLERVQLYEKNPGLYTQLNTK
ncbi:phage scaffolding protein [Psychrobacillus sp. FSL K6-2365]|uniref:phage scaffolding protein n=1 Tax=Psychrobacillus sp. FSL K6-2365 TaxID=2921546 RepID=UPI0030FCF4C1